MDNARLIKEFTNILDANSVKYYLFGNVLEVVIDGNDENTFDLITNNDFVNAEKINQDSNNSNPSYHKFIIKPKNKYNFIDGLEKTKL